MEFNRKNMQSMLLLITFGVVLFLGLQNASWLLGALYKLFRLLLPFIIGSVIAFILNVPMRAIEHGLFPEEPKTGRAPRALYRMRRPISLTLTLAAFVGVLALLIFTVWPEFKSSIMTLTASLPVFASNLTEWSNDLIARYPEIESYVNDFLVELSQVDWRALLEQLADFLMNGNLLGNTFSIASTIIGGITNAALGTIFAIYVLLQKERLGAGCKKLMYAWIPEHATDTAIEIARLTQRTFASFISGQCLEACILGTMFFFSMTLFQMPYASVVGILIAVTALIPIFGAFIGCFVGAFLILIVNPIQALWFIVLFLILQQIEGNLIYPHVVGNSVGLPSIWVLVAVTTGASTMGVIGMLINIPLFSVVYSLLRKYASERVRKRRIDPKKLK